MDVMLPDQDGLAALGRIRDHLPEVPVLFLTARDAVEDRIAGLTAGGDDYVTKPFAGRGASSAITGWVEKTYTKVTVDGTTLYDLTKPRAA
jgi:two-component system OmpR family response regulator